MARIFVDAGVFGEDWFSEILDELVRNNKVRFSYCAVQKLLGEHERARKLADFYKLMGEKGRRDDADPSRVESHIEHLESLPEWQRERDCDDPHVFAIVFEKPSPFVFTTDDDMAGCRRCINSVVDSKYCRFRLISRRESYQAHRDRINR